MKYYSIIQVLKKRLSNHEKYLKYILLRERSQSEVVIYCIIPTTCPSGKGKTMEIIKNQLLSGLNEKEDMNRKITGF